jgi:signal transduction histidine kinase
MLPYLKTLWRQSELYGRLEELNEELRLRDIAQREFINTAAHELRTPIQPILGLSEIVLKSNKDQDLNEYLVIIQQRLHRLTNNILDVTKIEGKILRLDKELVNLDMLISSLVNSFGEKQLWRERGLEKLENTTRTATMKTTITNTLEVSFAISFTSHLQSPVPL